MELFNLKEDLSESHNRATECPEKKKGLYGKLMKWQDKTEVPIPTELNPDYVSLDNQGTVYK